MINNIAGKMRKKKRKQSCVMRTLMRTLARGLVEDNPVALPRPAHGGVEAAKLQPGAIEAEACTTTRIFAASAGVHRVVEERGTRGLVGAVLLLARAEAGGTRGEDEGHGGGRRGVDACRVGCYHLRVTL